MARFATVDEYVGSLDPNLRAAAEAVQVVIDACLDDATSAIKWSHPTWSVGTEPVCYLKAASRHVTFGFWKGASIDDPSGRLESSGSVMAHAKLRSVDDVDPALFADWLRQARALVALSGSGARPRARPRPTPRR
jgi:hypothetical protein